MQEAKIIIKFDDRQYRLITSLLHALEEASFDYDAIYSGRVRITKRSRPSESPNEN